MKDLPKTWVSSNNRLKISDEKKYISSLNQKTLRNKRPLNATKEGGHCNQEELNSTKFEKKTSDQNCCIFTRLELRSQDLTCSTFI